MASAQTSTVEQRGRQDAPRATGPEGAVARRDPVALGLAQQQRGDEEARDREEDVDADEAAGEHRRPQVVDEDERHARARSAWISARSAGRRRAGTRSASADVPRARAPDAGGVTAA